MSRSFKIGVKTKTETAKLIQESHAFLNMFAEAETRGLVGFKQSPLRKDILFRQTYCTGQSAGFATHQTVTNANEVHSPRF